MRSFLVMLQFLTRFPLPFTVPCDDKTFQMGLRSFTAVGLLLGLALVGVGNILTRFIFDNWAVAILLTLFHLVATGGLHMDGVADSADGLLSNRSPERMLEIMKDSRIGSNGVLAIVMVLALKTVGIKLALDYGMWWVLMAMPVAGRFAVVFAAWMGKTPREQGMGNLFIGKATLPVVALNAAVFLALTPVLGYAPFAVVLGVLFTLWLIKGVTKLIGGITGDVLGTIIELNEVVYLFGFLVWARF